MSKDMVLSIRFFCQKILSKINKCFFSAFALLIKKTNLNNIFPFAAVC